MHLFFMNNNIRLYYNFLYFIATSYTFIATYFLIKICINYSENLIFLEFCNENPSILSD